MALHGVLLLLSVGLAASSESEKETGEKVSSKGLKIYTSEHDIVNIFTPVSQELKSLIKDIASESVRRAITERTDFIEKLYFVQGDYKDDGTYENKGLFVLKLATGEATKLLDNGTDITSVLDVDQEIKKVYFAATDGIYLYNAEKNTAEKYGSVTDNIVSIAQTKNGDVIYALTAEKILYKVTDNGEKKEKVDDVKDAQQIVLDSHDNLYFYDSKKRIFVKKYNDPDAPLIQFENLPIQSNKINLLRAMFDQEGICVVFHDTMLLSLNSTGHTQNLKPDRQILSATAHSMENRLIFYLAFNKSIYEYNLYKMLGVLVMFINF